MRSFGTVFAAFTLMVLAAGCRLPSPPREMRSTIKVEPYDASTYLVIVDAYYGNRHLGTPRMIVKRDEPGQCLLGQKTDAPADPFVSRDFGPVATNFTGLDVRLRVTPTRDSGTVKVDLLLQSRNVPGRSDCPEALEEFHGVTVELNREADLVSGSTLP